MSVNPRDLLICAAALGLVGISVPAGAEDREVVEETRVSSDGTTVRKVSTVMKSKVIIQDDEPAGQVVDFVFSDGGCIEYIVASYEDEYYVIPYSAATVRYGQSIVFVDITPNQFQNVQFFGANNWPDFYATGYRNRVFDTFGVTSIRNDVDVNVRGRGDRARDRADDARDRARDRRDDARDRADDRRDDAGDRADDARDRTRDRKDDARDRAEDAREKAKERADEARDRAKDRAGERKAQKPPIPKAGGNNPTPPKNALPNPPTPKKPAPKAPQNN